MSFVLPEIIANVISMAGNYSVYLNFTIYYLINTYCHCHISQDVGFSNCLFFCQAVHKFVLYLQIARIVILKRVKLVVG